MNRSKVFSWICAAVIVTACTSHKKNVTPAVPSAPVAATTVSSTPAVTTVSSPAKPADGIYAPGNEELVAIQSQYKDVTLDKLKEGYSVYTMGACLGCHNPLNIYTIPAEKCKDIIGDMAQRAAITDTQRDAVYKYVLAIKAAQPR